MLRTLFLGVAVCMLAQVAVAQNPPVRIGEIEISSPSLRAPLPGAPTAGGYLTLHNSGAADDHLIGGSAPFAAKVEVHQMTMQGDVMKMRALPDGLRIPAGETVTLKPGAEHLMFLGLTTRPVAGEVVPVTLMLEHAGSVTVDMPVVSAIPLPKK